MKGILAGIGALAMGLATSQLPAFDQQYTQRLGGAVDELRIITERFDASAREAGLSRGEAITRYAASGDPFLAGQGSDMESVFARYERLEAHLAIIRSANPVERTLGLTRYYDSEIGARTLDDFEPALPVTAEGLGFLAAGLGAGFILFWLVLTLIAAPFRRRGRAAHAPAARRT